METKAPLIAAIDVGTNSFHLVIASVNSRGMMQIRQREKEMVRLGSGTGDMKEILPNAMERGINALKTFSELAASENAKIRAVATSAVREALNQEEFLERVKTETGINIEVVSGAEEGRLIFTGVMHALPVYAQKTLVIDIGGGSTETVIGYKGEILYVNTVKLGTIRLSQRFFPDGNTDSELVQQCRDYVKGNWLPILKNVLNSGFEAVVGTAGTILNIAAMTLAGKNEAVPDVLNGLLVTREELLSVISRITQAHTTEDRKKIPGMDASRADIIIAGAIILEQAIMHLNIQKILVSAYALREGIVFDTVKKDKAISEFRNLNHLRYETIYHLCQQYRIDLVHSENVKNIALRIYDDLQGLHNLDSSSRELLEAASLLHDAGYHISHDQHHKHSYYIIFNCIMPGFTNNEAELIANIARYHRKSHPKKKHENFSKLTLDNQQVVRVLSSILRIAEGIDRRQLQIIKHVKAYFNEKEINIHLYPGDSNIIPDIELWGAVRRKPMMEETFGKKVNFHLEEKES